MQVAVPGLPEALVEGPVPVLLEVEVLVPQVLEVEVVAEILEVQLEDLPAWLPWLRNLALTPRPGGGTRWQSDRNVASKEVADRATRALIADRRGGGEFHHGGDGTES